MTTTVKVFAAALLVMAGGLAGCKSVQTTFVNTTGEALDLKITGPGLHVKGVHTIPPYGQVRTRIDVCTVWLPNIYSYKAGGIDGKFTIASDSNERIWVYVGEGTIPEAQYRHSEGDSKTGGSSWITINP